MICSKCGESVAGDDRYCPICGNDLYKQTDLEATKLAPEMDATVLATDLEVTVVSPDRVEGSLYPEIEEKQPVIENSRSEKNTTTLKIGIAVASVVAVIAVVFIVLLGTGKISFSNSDVTEPSTSRENPEPTKVEVIEPEIGTVSGLPVVIGDKSNKKIMMNMKSKNTDSSEFEIYYLAMDYTDDLLPVYVGMQKDVEQYGKMIMHRAYIGDSIYYINNLVMPDKTVKKDSAEGMGEVALLYFGIYKEEYLAEKNLKFEYLGKEKLETGNTYIYNVTMDGNTNKIWIDAETGCWVKVAGAYEISEIITGDDVDLPEIDFKNAISEKQFYNLEPDVGTEVTIPFITGDVSAKKIMLKTKTFTAFGNMDVKWIAADYTDAAEPKFYFDSKVYLNEGTESVLVNYAYYKNKAYMIMDEYPDETYLLNNTAENQFAFDMIFGIYDEDYMNKNGAKFCYMGKETLLATGEAYVFKEVTDDSETMLWIDADTGFWVKVVENGQIVLEVTEIITGDAVDLPDFDFENAIEY